MTVTESQPRQADAVGAGSQPIRVRSAPWRTVSLLILGDVVALVVAAAVAVLGRWVFEGQYNPLFYLTLWPALVLFVLVYAAVGLYSGAALYPGVALGPAEEFRRATWATSWVYLALGMGTFLLREAEPYSRAVFLIAWALSLAAVPLMRAAVRHGFAHRPWWGYPALILGAGKTAQIIIRSLRKTPGLGLKPVAILDDDPGKFGELESVPVLGPIGEAPRLTREHRIPYVIIAMPGASGEQLKGLYDKYGDSFPHILLIPQLVGFSSLWVSAKDLGGVLGLEIRQQLLLPWARVTKRTIDLALTVVGGICVLPLIGLMALAIKLESRGPVFFGHRRIGRGGQAFTAWKFRTMVHNAQEVLQDYLRDHPELRAEWERDHKLKNDPRITRVGRFLRMSSLDELPQLYNVVRGEMALVGPRPIVDAEVPKYAERFGLYKKVLPGITGLWQVSGRNNVTYDERVGFDSYYVYNWSVWLDLYILAKTILVVPFQRGAY